MRIADGGVANVEPSGCGLDHGGRRHQTFVQRQTDDKRFHGGAGLEGVGQGAVTQLLAAHVLTRGRRIAGVVGERQDLTALHIEHHHTASFRLMKQNRIAQLLVGKELHFAVDAELQIAPVNRRHLFANRLHHTAPAILDDPARARAPGQLLIKGELNAFLANVLNIGEAHHMRCGLALGVLALVLLALVNALDSQGHHFLGHAQIHLPLEPDEALVFVGQPLVQLGHRQLEQTSQLFESVRVTFHVFWHGPNAGCWDAGRQDQAIAVQHPATVGRQVERSGKTHGPLLLKKIIFNDLDMNRSHRQHTKSKRNRRHDQFAAPDRGAAGQQRAGGIGDAAAHRFTASDGAALAVPALT